MQISKLSVQPAYQMVFAELQRFIVSGAIQPGDMFPGEVELATKFGVNRSTVREGIRQLEAEGLVTRVGRKKLLVSVPGYEQLSPRAARALVMQQVTFRELWDVSHALEPLAAGLAAEFASDEDVAALQSNLEETENLLGAGSSTGKTDLAFHSLISRTARNNALLLAREPIGSLLYPAFEAFASQLPQAAARNLEAHRAIVKAIGDRDTDGATRWMRRHIEDLRRGWTLADIDLSQPIPAHQIL